MVGWMAMKNVRHKHSLAPTCCITEKTLTDLKINLVHAHWISLMCLLMRRLYPILLTAIVTLACTSCDKRGPVRTELEMAIKDLEAKKEQFLALQNESKALSATMGKYNTAGQGLIDQLTKEAAVLQTAIEGLKKEKQVAEQKNTEASAEIRTYLENHAKP